MCRTSEKPLLCSPDDGRPKEQGAPQFITDMLTWGAGPRAAQCLVLGAKAGVDPSKIADVLQGGLAATRVLEMRRDNMLSGSFDPGFRIRLHLKDLKNALELARETNVPLPGAALVDQLMRAAAAAARIAARRSSAPPRGSVPAPHPARRATR